MKARNKILSFLILTTASLTAVILFIIIPTITDIKKISNSIYLERIDLETKYLKGQLLRKTIKDFENYKNEKEKFKKIFIAQGDELEFITTLEKIATDRQILQSFKIKDSKQETAGYHYPLNLQIILEGNFFDIMNYLADLEKLDYYFNIYNTSVVAEKEKNGVKMILEGRVFILTQ